MSDWQTFITEAEAEEYAVACWVRVLRDRAAEGDGTLRDVHGAKVQLVKDWPADVDAIAAKITDPEQVAEDLEAVPLYGRRNGRLVTGEPSTWTLRWAIPQVTADGRWAVPCPPFDVGDPEPEWPTPPRLSGAP